MKKKVLFGVGVIVVLAICLCVYLLSGAGSTYYYSQIDNSKIEQTESAGGVINFGGSMDYYILLFIGCAGNDVICDLGSFYNSFSERNYIRDGGRHRGTESP